MTDSSRKIIPTWRNNESSRCSRKLLPKNTNRDWAQVNSVQYLFHSQNIIPFTSAVSHSSVKTTTELGKLKDQFFLFFNLIRAKAVPTTHNNNLTANNLFQYTWATSHKQLFKINNITLSLVAINSQTVVRSLSKCDAANVQSNKTKNIFRVVSKGNRFMRTSNVYIGLYILIYFMKL